MYPFSLIHRRSFLILYSNDTLFIFVLFSKDEIRSGSLGLSTCDTLLSCLSVDVRKLQVAILARSYREMYQTVRIH